MGIGLESLGKKTGLLLDFGEIIKVLGFGGFEGDSLGEIINGGGSIAFLGIDRSQGSSNFGIVGVEFLGLGKVGNGLGQKLGLGGEDTVINPSPLEKAAIILRKKFDGFGGSQNGLVKSVDILVLTGLGKELLRGQKVVLDGFGNLGGGRAINRGVGSNLRRGGEGLVFIF